MIENYEFVERIPDAEFRSYAEKHGLIYNDIDMRFPDWIRPDLTLYAKFRRYFAFCENPDYDGPYDDDQTAEVWDIFRKVQ